MDQNNGRNAMTGIIIGAFLIGASAGLVLGFFMGAVWAYQPEDPYQ